MGVKDGAEGSGQTRRVRRDTEAGEAKEEGGTEDPIRGRRRTWRRHDGARDKSGASMRMANNIRAQKRYGGSGDAPEGPGLESMGAETAPPTPHPTPQPAVALKYNTYSRATKWALRRERRSGEPLHILRHGCRAGVAYPPGKQHGAEATVVGRLVGPD